MFVNSVLSFLGAWEKIQAHHAETLGSLFSVINSVEPVARRPTFSVERRTKHPTRRTVDTRRLRDSFSRQMKTFGWTSDLTLQYQTLRKDSRYYSRLDYYKDGLGLELLIGKYPFAESKLFVDFPFFVRANQIDIGGIMIPTSALAQRFSRGVASFEKLTDRLMALPPLTLQYPFAVFGFSQVTSDIELTELTSELDQFLIEQIGIPLGEALAINETKLYEFKLELPNNEKLAKQVCSFANAPGGGLILIGIDKEGKTRGLPKGVQLDEIRTRIVNVINDRCSPIPKFEILTFNVPDEEARVLMAIKVHEISRKPCMTGNRVYVRADASARPAGPEEIRRLIVK